MRPQPGTSVMNRPRSEAWGKVDAKKLANAMARRPRVWTSVRPDLSPRVQQAPDSFDGRFPVLVALPSRGRRTGGEGHPDSVRQINLAIAWRIHSARLPTVAWYLDEIQG
ncbi:hypothetical protein N7492_008770 [Penicillium capsulatum]|uniref:Uncharacterized protein n=1 Tax=Penicillium capsulatum TaxID=69766 RepID=A0A9W9LHF1_9EURO|nr:hypothetical protein N7492_008770 [Penicillium capsulatum]KAJ6106173.1 hypothetical protein N7512_009690 [Penicillium capsulatum]